MVVNKNLHTQATQRERETDRERQRERERQTEKDRQTDRERERERNALLRGKSKTLAFCWGCFSPQTLLSHPSIQPP